jgi:dihydroorotate dehydrogenase (NAD+) catalytic subunit
MAIRPDLSVDIGGLRLKNPVIAASGTFGYGSELSSFYDPSLLGAIVVKGLSLKPIPGNPPPRIVETPCGLLNSIGLANIGIDAFLEEKLPLLATTTVPVIANIYGHAVEEYRELAGKIEEVEGISGIEVNISCPNVSQGGMVFGMDPETAAMVTDGVAKHTTKPVIVKLTPNAADITVIAKAVESAGARALSVTNTFLGMSVDIASRRPKLATGVGGLSGPAIKPLALYLTSKAVQAVRIPVIGLGGIMNHHDALEFLLVGARAVQVGTANFINPRAALEIVNGLMAFCEKEHISNINHLIGSLHLSSDEV